MKKETILLGISLAMLFAAFVLSIISVMGINIIPQESHSRNGGIQAKPKQGSPPGTFETITTGGTDPGQVAIDLAPKGVSNGNLEVEMKVNTHSVDLTQFDLKELTTLEADGKAIKPSSAPSMSGHHVSGILLFPAGKSVKAFTIKIRGIPPEDERVYSWG